MARYLAALAAIGVVLSGGAQAQQAARIDGPAFYVGGGLEIGLYGENTVDDDDVVAVGGMVRLGYEPAQIFAVEAELSYAQAEEFFGADDEELVRVAAYGVLRTPLAADRIGAFGRAGVSRSSGGNFGNGDDADDVRFVLGGGVMVRTVDRQRVRFDFTYFLGEDEDEDDVGGFDDNGGGLIQLSYDVVF